MCFLFNSAVADIPHGANFFANGTATFINGPAILLNNEPRNRPDGTILDICVLDNFISVGILFSNAFFNFFFSCC